MTNQPQKHRPALHEYLHQHLRWKSVGLRLLVGLCVLIVVVWFGRHAASEIKVMETWIAGHGALGWFAFVAMVVVFTSMFVPQTMLSIAGGAMFGLFGGTVLTFIGAVLTAAFNYLLAGNLLRSRIKKILDKHPKLQAIQRVADREGLKLQLLLRLSPLSPVTVSYVLGASGVRFSTFLIAMVGLLPTLFVSVYFGYVASHATKVAGDASEHSTTHTVLTFVGFLVAILVMIGIGRVAKKAIHEAEKESSESTPAENSSGE